MLTSIVIGLMLEYAAATTLDLLNRDPVGLATLFIVGRGFLLAIQGERHFGYLR